MKADGFVAALAPVAAKVASRALARRGAVPGVLHRSAVLFLAKVSCVSRGVCEEYLPLLITTLARAPDALARQNVAVALGDLASQTTEQVEPWTDHVYGALRDSDATVRAAVLATLAHLALNDMIKARGGGVAEVALLVVDGDDTDHEEERARAFFEELHKKSTAQSRAAGPGHADLQLVAGRRVALDDAPRRRVDGVEDTPVVQEDAGRRRRRRRPCGSVWRRRRSRTRPRRS